MLPEAAELGTTGCDDNGVASTNYDAFATKFGSPSKLPSPITVTVVMREGLDVEDVDPQGDDLSQRSACRRDRFVAGKVRGIFHPELYLITQDCITYKGKRISRSKFERLGNSSMAKWHRSIRVIHDDGSLEPLGEWLGRHGLPVLKGKQRTSRRRPHAKPPSMSSALLPAVAAAKMRLAGAVRGLTVVGGLSVPALCAEAPAADPSLLSNGTAAGEGALTCPSAVRSAGTGMFSATMTELLSDALMGRRTYNRTGSCSSRDSSLKGDERQPGSDGGEDDGDVSVQHDWVTGTGSGPHNSAAGDYLPKVPSSGVGASGDEASPAAAATPVAGTPLGAAHVDAGAWAKAGWSCPSLIQPHGQSCRNHAVGTDTPTLAAAAPPSLSLAPAPILTPSLYCAPNPRSFLHPTSMDGMAAPPPSSRPFGTGSLGMHAPAGCSGALTSTYQEGDPATMAFATAPAQVATAALLAPNAIPNPLELISDSAIWYDEKTTTECVLALFGESEDAPNDDAAAAINMAPNATNGAVHSSTATEPPASSLAAQPSFKRHLTIQLEAHPANAVGNTAPGLHGTSVVSQCRSTPFATATANTVSCQQSPAAVEPYPTHLARTPVTGGPLVSGEAKWGSSCAVATPELKPVNDMNRLHSMPSPPGMSVLDGSLHGWPFVPQVAGGDLDCAALYATPVSGEGVTGNDDIRHAMAVGQCSPQEHLTRLPAAQMGPEDPFQRVAHGNSWAAEAASEPAMAHFAVPSSSGLDSCPTRIGDVATMAAPTSAVAGQLRMASQTSPSPFVAGGYSTMSLSLPPNSNATNLRSSMEEQLAGYGPTGICRRLPPTVPAASSAALPVIGPVRRPHYRVAYASYPRPPYYLPYYPPLPGYARMRVPDSSPAQIPGVPAEGAVWPVAGWPARAPPPPPHLAAMAPPSGVVHYWRRRAQCPGGTNAATPMPGYAGAAGWTPGTSQAPHLQQQQQLQYLQQQQQQQQLQQHNEQQQQQGTMAAASTAVPEAGVQPMEAPANATSSAIPEGPGAVMTWGLGPLENAAYPGAPWDNSRSAAVQVDAAGGMSQACGVPHEQPAVTYMSHVMQGGESLEGTAMMVRTGGCNESSGAYAFAGPLSGTDGWGEGQGMLPMAAVAHLSSTQWGSKPY